MQRVRRIGRAIENWIVGAVTGTVAGVSRIIDGLIGLVGRLSERLDARLSSLADASRARHRREGRRQIDPISLE